MCIYCDTEGVRAAYRRADRGEGIQFDEVARYNVVALADADGTDFSVTGSGYEVYDGTLFEDTPRFNFCPICGRQLFDTTPYIDLASDGRAMTAQAFNGAVYWAR